MRRRDLLKLATLAPCAPLMVQAPRTRAASQTASPAAASTPPPAPASAETLPRRRVRPADADWPSQERWRNLSDAVGGNLIEVQPLFDDCQADTAACADTLRQLRNPFYLGDQAAGTQVSGWQGAWTPAPSAYAIKARNTADIVAGVDFARSNNLRLVVKGTGHSYLGTSNCADSLMIWTRAMNRVELHEAFVPAGCADQPVRAVSAEAGAVSIDLYDAVTTRNGRYVQCGGCTDTGVAGITQSGGFGSFSKGFGTAAANLLEADVVTADGRVLTVNACRNADLFWALKGGGGGSFGVVSRLTMRTHDLPERFGAVFGRIGANSDAAFKRLTNKLLEFYRQNLLNPYWGEQLKFSPDNTLEVSMVCQGLGQADIERCWKPFTDWVNASAELHWMAPINMVAVPARMWWNAERNPFLVRDMREGSPPHRAWWHGDQDQVGAYLHGYESLWLPAALLQSGARTTLVDALFAASRFKTVSLHTNKGLAGATGAARAATAQTAMNPAVLDAFALAIIADGEGAAYPGMSRPPVDRSAAKADARAIDLATAPLRRLVPDAGSYVSESNYFNRAWQRAHWGDHYARLLRVKRAYDPEGLFYVHHGVGSEGWSADGFTRA